MDIVPTLVAILGSGGLGAVTTSVINSIMMARKGIATREGDRRDDIIKARDFAWARMAQAEADADEQERRADAERTKRIQWEEHAARLRIQLINAGHEPDESTIPKKELP